MTVLAPADPPPVALPTQPEDVPWPTDGWPTGPPPDHVSGPLDALLDQAFCVDGSDRAQARFGQSLAFVAIHQGRLVAERYGPTAGPGEQLISWSMAKSFAQALIGILVADGLLSLDDSAPVAGWSGPGDPRSTITIDQLLRMVPGTTFNEDYVDEVSSHCIQMLFGDGHRDMAAYTAALPAETQPDTRFNYASGTTVLLCKIMANIVGPGPRFEAWMNRVLLGPLGIEARLTFDDAGTWVGSSYLHTSARHFAKFGLLYLRDGIWDGRRLLPEGWVDYARTPRARDDDGNCYGAHWWIRAHDEAVFYASGYETQRIIVDPAKDLVLVRLGKTPTELADDVDRWLDRIADLFD
ncbi:MAG: serine hydrolase domain-containing protein [Acidimicrobiales bacterium]